MSDVAIHVFGRRIGRNKPYLPVDCFVVPPRNDRQGVEAVSREFVKEECGTKKEFPKDQ